MLILKCRLWNFSWEFCTCYVIERERERERECVCVCVQHIHCCTGPDGSAFCFSLSSLFSSRTSCTWWACRTADFRVQGKLFCHPSWDSLSLIKPAVVRSVRKPVARCSNISKRRHRKIWGSEYCPQNQMWLCL